MDQDYKNQQVLKKEDCHIYSMIEKTLKNAHMYDQLDIESCKAPKMVHAAIFLKAQGANSCSDFYIHFYLLHICDDCNAVYTSKWKV